ncbi:MAG: YdbL family protein [Gammaproteobacteria bacterium]|nr:YdbL family protein [Gammaproteobacteria bacterium]
MRTTKYAALLVGLLLAACVTINVYFPAAAAEQAADKIINDVLGTEGNSSRSLDNESAASGTPGATMLLRASRGLLELLVPSAHAQQANLDISSPGVRRIQAAMKARNPQLEAFYDSGAVGFTSDAMVAVRDLTAVALKDRNTVRQLVADENRDRDALYREIAIANEHPEWEDEIRATFARRWVANAKPGWYYQNDGGTWVRK